MDREAIIKIMCSSLGSTESYRYIFEKEKDYAKAVKIFFTKRFEYSKRNRADFILNEDKNGFLISFDSAKSSISSLEALREGWNILLNYRLSTIKRLFKIIKLASSLEKHLSGDYSTLSAIGVMEDCQGQGIGTKLMDEFMEKNRDKAIILVTASKRNVEFYEKYRFSVSAEVQEPIYIALMVKQPE
jgi:ribosomal protein S18 acetylase RimI-like enzyme